MNLLRLNVAAYHTAAPSNELRKGESTSTIWAHKDDDWHIVY